MARGQLYGSERIHFTDPRSGVGIVQLTSYPRISWNMYFEHNHFTPEGRTVIFLRQRDLRPGSPADLYRCDVDGRNLAQLTDEDGIYGIALSRDGRHAYYLQGTTLKRVALDTFELAEVLSVPDAQPGGVLYAGQSGDGRSLFCTLRVGEESGLFRLATDGSSTRMLARSPVIYHVVGDPGHDVVSFGGEYAGRRGMWLVDADGGEPRLFPLQRFAHATWLGRTGRLQGCLLPPGRAIVTMAERDAAPEPLVAGPYFWHSGASLDGEWIVADTNWPDEGLMLAHVPTRSFTFLCDAHSGNDDGYLSHPEPALSPDGSVAIWTSTRTGIPQVYVAPVPEAMRTALRRSLEWEGEPGVPGDHYMARWEWKRV